MKKVLQTFFLNNVSWKIISPFVWLSDRAKESKENYNEASKLNRLHEKVQILLTEHVVRHGPFKGMNFGNARRESDSIYAKLLGSYETEIHLFFEKVFKKKYSSILNIGCEDGFYAVGLALQMPNVAIKAFDSNSKAIQNSKELANLNNVGDRISFYGKCTSANIDSLDMNERMLLVVDCEGDEGIIFNKNNAMLLAKSDLLIELHINIYPLLEKHFRELFDVTHKIYIVNSIDDHIKTLTYNFPETEGMDYETKRFMIGERNVFMQWMFMESKYFDNSENDK